MPYAFRRVALASLTAAGIAAACSYASVNEEGVRARAAERMDCEPTLLKLENVAGPSEGVARYTVTGCGRTTTLDCTEDDAGVSCASLGRSETNGASAGNTAVAVGAAGCACARLLSRSSKSSDPPSESTASPMSTTPQRSK